MNAAINLNHQPRRIDRKINNIPPYGMLSADRKPTLSKLAKGLPSGIFCAGCRFTENSCAVGWALHPLTLNPSPQRGEGLLNQTLLKWPDRRISTPMTDQTSRLDELEIRIAHQDQTIEDLNAAITAQWKIIDKLERQVSRLTDRVAEAENSLGEAPPAHQPPPHY